jgi:toxin YoeB
LSKKKRKKVEADEIKPVVVNRSPGFSSIFKENLALWFKQDGQKASKILDFLTAVMQDPFDGIGKPELLSDRFILNQWLRLGDRLIVSHAASVTLG